MIEVAINPNWRGAEQAAAFVLATNQANEFVPDESLDIGQVVIRQRGITSHSFQLPVDVPPLVVLGRQSGERHIQVALGLVDNHGRTRERSKVVNEITYPRGLLAILSPPTLEQRVIILSVLLRGMFSMAWDSTAAREQLQEVPIVYGIALMPTEVSRHFAGMLFARGAAVVVYSDGEAIGVKISKEAQETGLDARQITGIPDHWHRESWTVVHGSAKAPRPIDEAGMDVEELYEIIIDWVRQTGLIP